MSKFHDNSESIDQASGAKRSTADQRLTGRESALILSAFATLALSIASLLTL